MSNNLGLPQMTTNTADKDDFVNDIFALLDAAITSALSIDASVNALATTAQLQNYLKLVATNVPKAGTTITLPAVARMLILGNDKASLGSVTYSVGSTSIVIAPSGRCVVHLDGTANGFEVVSAGAGGSATTLAALTDIDLTTAPINGQVLTYNDSEAKWKPGTPASGGSGGGSASQRSARYWRLARLGAKGGFVGTGTMVYFDASGSVIPQTAYYSNGSDTDPLPNAFDNDLTTYWTTNNNGVGYLGVDFGAAKTPTSFQLSPRDNNMDCNINNCTVQYSADKLTWLTVCDVAPTWNGQNDQLQTFAIPAV